jgi:hypothetical protein
MPDPTRTSSTLANRGYIDWRDEWSMDEFE